MHVLVFQRLRLALLAGLALALGLMIAAPAGAQQPVPRGPILTAEVDGTLSHASIDYLRRAIGQAEAANATALIIRLGTRGGVLASARVFAGEIAAAGVPVVVQIAPAGTSAGPAGTLLLAASHLAVMAPETSFGSPQPLTTVETALTAQTRQLVLDSVADQLRAWQSSRGRDASWVDQAVASGVILTNVQAINSSPPTIDLVAGVQQELLTLLHNRTVQLADGTQVTIETLGQRPEPIPPTLWEQIRLLLAQPTVAFLLLILGGIAIYLELASPGTSLFAGIGIVLLVGALLGFLALPVQWWALVLVVLAFGVTMADLYTPSHGGLTVIGLVLMITGALNLYDQAQAPGVFVALWAVALVAVVLAGFAALGLYLAVKARSRPHATGSEGLVGKLAEARSRLAPDGMVFVEGALWRAVSRNGTVEAGEYVRVMAVHDLRLLVERVEPQPDAL